LIPIEKFYTVVLAEYAMGWLGWTYEELLECGDVNAISVGTRGRVKMYSELLKAFGGAKPDESKKKLSFAQKFKMIASSHNKRLSREKRK